jgi:uncharacterized OB-fold protein
MSESQNGLIEPSIDVDSAPWWAAAAAGTLVVPHCTSCGRTWFPPTPACPRCGSVSIELKTASGSGTIYSWVVIYRPLNPEFAGDVPYTVVMVDLAEGGRIAGRLLGSADPSHELAGASVHADFYTVRGQALVGFRLD